jgi:hypothetical protein
MPDSNQTIQPTKRQPLQQAPSTKLGASQDKPAPQPEENLEEYKPKLSVWEIVIITPFYLISDALEFLLFLFGLTDFGIISMVRTSVSEFYFIIIKKMRKEIWLTNLIVGAITALPYIGALIPSTIGWGIVVFVDQFGMKKIESALNKTGVAGKAVMKIAKKADKV